MPSTQPPTRPSPSSTTPTLQEMLIHAPFVRAVARAAVWGDQQVDDVVQATWLAALEKGPRHAASLKGWLATVTRNAARAMGRGDGRRAARERNAARPEALDSTAEIVAKEEIRRQLVEAVLGLRQPYRSVILLRYYEHLSPRAVAARLGIPRETARTQIKRGLKLLRESLDEQHAGDRRAWAVAASGLAPLAGASAAGVLAGLGLAKLAAAATVVLLGVVAVTRLSGDATSPGATPSDEAPVAQGPELALARPAKAVAGTGFLSGTVRLPVGATGARVDAYFQMPLNDFQGPANLFNLRSPLPQGDPVASVDVGSDGRFRVAGLADGIFQVWAVAGDGFTDIRAAVVFDAGSSQPVRLSLVPGSHRLEGRIRHADGTPFRGLVSLASSEGGMVLVGLPEGPAPRSTDAEGRFTFEGLRGGTVSLLVVEPGERVLREPLRLPLEDPFDLVLDAGAERLRGSVVNDVDRTPLPGASLLAIGGGERRFSVRRVPVDSAGHFEIAIEGTRTALVARAPGFVYESVQVKDPAAEQTIALAPLARLRVSVVSAEDGTPLGGIPVYVSALRRRDGIALRGGKAPTSNGAGMLTIDTEPGEVMVAAFGAGWMSEALPDVSETFNPFVVTARPGETVDVRLEVVAAARVEGVVKTVAGDPVAGVGVVTRAERGYLPRGCVRIPSAHTRSDADGAYVLDAVWPGTAVRVSASSVEYGLTESEPFAIKAGERRTLDVNLVVPRFLDVRVVDQDGEPVPAVRVSVYRQQPSGSWRGRPAGVSAEDGTLRLGPLSREDGQYQLSGEGFIEERGHKPLPEVRDGEVASLRVERGAAIVGRVVTPEGMSAARLEVRFRAEDRLQAKRGRVQTNAAGVFRFEGLAKGRYVVTVSRAWQGAQWKAREIVASGAHDALLKLAVPAPKKRTPEARAGWQLRLLSPDGGPVHASWRWRYGEYEWQAGISSLGGGGAVRSPLSVARDDRVRRMWIELLNFEDSGKKRLPYAPQLLGPFDKTTPSGVQVVRLEAGQVIEGRVLGPGGDPVRGTTVSAHAQYAIGVTSREAHGTARTDEDGRFRLSGLGRFNYELRPALGVRYAPVLPVSARAGASDVAIRVLSAVAVTLKIVDHEGAPVARATVSARLREDLLGGSKLPRGVQRDTDSKGRLRLVGLDPAAAYKLVIRAPQDAHEALNHEINEWTPADGTIALARGYILSGHVRTSAGLPVEDAAVYRKIGPNGWTTTLTDKHGAFRFNQLPDVMQTLAVTATGRMSPHEEGTLRRSVAPGSREVGFTLELPPSIEIVFPEAKVEMVRVRLTEERAAGEGDGDKTPGAAPTETQAPRPIREVFHGMKRYVVRGLLAEASYTAWITGGGGVFLARGVRAGDTVHAKPVPGTTATLRLRLPAGLPDGMGWQHARVVVSGTGWVIRPRLVEPKKGVFQVSGIPEGPLHIEVTMERWESGSKGVAPRRVGPRFRGSADVPLSSELVLELTEE